jgi:hypothetical protein
MERGGRRRHGCGPRAIVDGYELDNFEGALGQPGIVDLGNGGARDQVANDRHRQQAPQRESTRRPQRRRPEATRPQPAPGPGPIVPLNEQDNRSPITSRPATVLSMRSTASRTPDTSRPRTARLPGRPRPRHLNPPLRPRPRHLQSHRLELHKDKPQRSNLSPRVESNIQQETKDCITCLVPHSIHDFPPITATCTHAPSLCTSYVQDALPATAIKAADLN